MHGSRMHSMFVFQTMTLKRICSGDGMMSIMRFEILSADVRARTNLLADRFCDSRVVALSLFF